jgi:cellulose synthase/poly-beta-1,6-N-acetylglucosamine synthase-like glycosyltransferase
MNWMKRTVLNWKWWLNMDNPYGHLPMPVMSLTVAIPAHNDGKSVRGTIESVLRQTYNRVHPIKLILVNDGSTDNTREVMEEYRGHPQVQAIYHTPVKTGRKAAAAMIAFADVDTELFLALDGDGVLSDDAVEKSITRFSNPKVQMVAGCVMAQNHGTFFERARTGEYLSAFATVKPAQDRLFGILIASGCFSIIKSETLREVGGYQTRTLGEDLDLTLAMHEHHKKVVYAGDAVCTVVDPKTRQNFEDQITRWFTSYIQCMRVHGWKAFRKPLIGLAFYGYFIWSFISPFFLIVLLTVVLKSLPLSLITFFAMWALVVWLPMYVKAIQMKMNLWTVTKCLLPMFAAQYVNIWCFYKVFLREFGLVKPAVNGDGWGKVH